MADAWAWGRMGVWTCLRTGGDTTVVQAYDSCPRARHYLELGTSPFRKREPRLTNNSSSERAETLKAQSNDQLVVEGTDEEEAMPGKE
ncbi:hypothetical protein GGTG_05497 [Gaeumannomyces tritici R3-111a-1]|uniref:Uncharacterized protein n=1 Tax=Gaeumannomyces tritici (strain R3-111a-1) TaxID=644352 RepID=J3NW34_GAET3|nr:hypothetical protein GGTG_05497 [Gaeumannomyces tritici R3-111a-1]EJT75564.1 hypothetical protein GGTG_05497 [Gaeumannomyces tritici R3-111a-1]